MKLVFAYRMLLPSAVLCLGLVVPTFGQSANSAIASQQMNAAGQLMNQAGSDTATAAKDVYHGTADAVHDSEITAKVKAALHRDNVTEHSKIHVTTSARIVTLRGTVASTHVAKRAQELAQNAAGVREVRNELTVLSPRAD
jgi:osmotically-inducible protein OsmY